MSTDIMKIGHTVVTPESVLAVLSRAEINDLCSAKNPRVYELFRRCALAVLASGLESDDARAMFEQFADFAVEFEEADHQVRLHLTGAPARAFVDGEMIRGVRQQLYSVLRDIVFVTN